MAALSGGKALALLPALTVPFLGGRSGLALLRSSLLPSEAERRPSASAVPNPITVLPGPCCGRDRIRLGWLWPRCRVPLLLSRSRVVLMD